jgi:hypothetical protein
MVALPKEIAWDDNLMKLSREPGSKAGYTLESLSRGKEKLTKQWQYSRKLWSFVVSTLSTLQVTGELKVKDPPDWASKVMFNYLVAEAHETACIYKALETGWDDVYLGEVDGVRINWVEMGITATTSDDFFLELLAMKSECSFASVTWDGAKLFTSRTTGRHLATINLNESAKKQMAEITPDSYDYARVKDASEDYDRSVRLLLKKQSLPVSLIKQDLCNIFNYCLHQLFASPNPEAVMWASKWLAAYEEVCSRSQSYSLSLKKPINSIEA